MATTRLKLAFLKRFQPVHNISLSKTKFNYNYHNKGGNVNSNLFYSSFIIGSLGVAGLQTTLTDHHDHMDQKPEITQLQPSKQNHNRKQQSNNNSNVIHGSKTTEHNNNGSNSNLDLTKLMYDQRYWKSYTKTLHPSSIIDFYSPDDSNPYRFLANFYPSPFKVNDKLYKTAEHYYQSHKFIHKKKIFNQIINAKTPRVAKKLSRVYSSDVRNDWNKVKNEVMYDAIKYKFLQNRDLLQMLFMTGTKILRERIPDDAPPDTYWGWNPKHGGDNFAGKLSMQVRSELGGYDVFGVTYSYMIMRGDKVYNIAVFKDINHLAIIIPPRIKNNKNDPLVRLHSRCWTGDVFNSVDCDCRSQLWRALEEIENNDSGGVLLYLDQEGRGLGIVSKIRGYCLLHQGIDTVDAYNILGIPVDTRSFSDAGEMLKRLGIANVKLMTNNPYKRNGLENSGINVTKCVRMKVEDFNLNEISEAYFRTKVERMGHHSDLLNQSDE